MACPAYDGCFVGQFQCPTGECASSLSACGQTGGVVVTATPAAGLTTQAAAESAVWPSSRAVKPQAVFGGRPVCTSNCARDLRAITTSLLMDARANPELVSLTVAQDSNALPRVQVVHWRLTWWTSVFWFTDSRVCARCS